MNCSFSLSFQSSWTMFTSSCWGGGVGAKVLTGHKLFMLPLIPEQLDNVSKYYRESQDAERKCNASVSGPNSPVGQSQKTRKQAEDLLDSRRDRFLRTMAAQKKSLEELHNKANDLGRKVDRVSDKVRNLPGSLVRGVKQYGSAFYQVPCVSLANCSSIPLI